MEPMMQLLKEIDDECEEHGLPPLSRLVMDKPGVENATNEEIAEVHEAAAQGKYKAIGIVMPN
jgi:hypothetical protein